MQKLIFNPSRFVTQLLSDLIYFVAYQDAHSAGNDPLEVEVNKQKDYRERQKLLREQNIIKQVLYGQSVNVYPFQSFVIMFFKSGFLVSGT